MYRHSDSKYTNKQLLPCIQSKVHIQTSKTDMYISLPVHECHAVECINSEHLHGRVAGMLALGQMGMRTHLNACFSLFIRNTRSPQNKNNTYICIYIYTYIHIYATLPPMRLPLVCVFALVSCFCILMHVVILIY